MRFITFVTSALSGVMNWIGSIVTGLLSEYGPLHSLLPLFAIGISIAALLFCIRIIKRFIWGA